MEACNRRVVQEINDGKEVCPTSLVTRRSVFGLLPNFSIAVRQRNFSIFACPVGRLSHVPVIRAENRFVDVPGAEPLGLLTHRSLKQCRRRLTTLTCALSNSALLAEGAFPTSMGYHNCSPENCHGYQIFFKQLLGGRAICGTAFMRHQEIFPSISSDPH